MEKERVSLFFKRFEDIPAEIIQQIRDLVREGEGVGTAFLDENLRNAFLIGYAMVGPRVVGTVTHKHPKPEYRRKIEAATGLDLSGYLERGYTVVAPPYRDRDIAHRLIRGLIQRSRGRKIYVTIRMDNPAPLRLTLKNGMSLAATFLNPRTGHELGVFTNQRDTPKRRTAPT
ncbi:MAG: GNAT family N-acetyltransferase [Deltaproteobacteria bacterium]|nr:GNAT family N-acetyltransferase [Deltaproteobacteria bacterium]MBW1922421.1 GNAT family N-acetyltransferase [Deltaproteobacteria bacterium]MBW1949344.1 GNAT family N-acetyltransferase [Deltaproteobacteria bacterium]MBW2007265.1 GNAT family N-acetyltransferase [Deltaproteobacteria bacterium]MBW2101293.1 GNAT family N-acetyltransferase [Deltaproteobacteria bacterium]